MSQSLTIDLSDTVSILASITSLVIACYALYVSKVSTENQIISSILTNISHQTNYLEHFINDLLANRTRQFQEKFEATKNGRALIEAYQWSYIFTPLVKIDEMFTMYHREYEKVLNQKQFDLILKTIYIQIPQLVKIRIFEVGLTSEFENVTNEEVKQILLRQLKTSKDLLAKASKR